MATYYKTRLMQCGYLPVFVCLMLLSGLGISAAHASSCSDYAATPPFLTASVKPNVVFMLDNSWTMKFPIYLRGNDYDPKKKYYGLFDSTKNYAYNDSIPVDTSSFDGHPATLDTPGAPYDLRDGSKEEKILINTSAKGAFVEDTSSCTPGPGRNCWKGNFLNWMTTRRIDAARKVLVGGKVETRSGFDYLGNGSKTWKIVGNNEPADDPQPISKTYRSSQNQSPFPNGTNFHIYSPAYYGGKKRSYTGQYIDLYDPYGKIEPMNVSLPFFLTDKSGAVIGEIGTVTTDYYTKTPKSVKLLKAYTNPVIVAKPLTFTDGTPSTIRINYNPDNKSQFRVWVDEWEYNDGGHFYENITYMVLEQGTHTLPGTGKDLKIVAGATNISGNLNADLIDKKTNSWQTIDIGTSQLANVPVVIASVTSINDPIAVTTRIKKTSKEDFMIALQREEKDVRIHSSETVHYIAMEPGLTAGSTQIKAGTEPDFNHNFKNLNFTEIPAKAFVADMQTTNDAEPASLRYISLNTSHHYRNNNYEYVRFYDLGLDTLKAYYNSFVDRLKVEEELSRYYTRPSKYDWRDYETNHGNETVGYIAVASPRYNIAVLNNSEPKGLIQDIAKKVRVGLSCYRYQRDSDIYRDGSADGGTLRLSIPNNPFVLNNAHISKYRQLDTHVKATPADIIDGVEHYPLIFGTTPLAENLYEVGRYFSQVKPYYDNSPCIKSQSSQLKCDTDYLVKDTWDPYMYKINGEDKKMKCAKSFVIILTDGEPWADGNVPTNDKDLPVQGNWLPDVAKSLYGGGNKDLRSDMDDNQYLQVSTIALANNTIPDILEKTAANANGTAHAAEDGEKLEKALNSAITLIENRTSTGASLSLLSEKTTAGSMINQALLFPEKTFKEGHKVDWIGTINAFWFYNPANNKNISGISDMRENTTYEKFQDYALDIYDDRALDFKLDLNGSLKIHAYNIIQRNNKLAGTPDPDSAPGKKKGPAVTYNNIDDVKKIFDIGNILKERKGSDRTVYGVGNNDTLVAFTQGNVSQFVEKFKLPSSPTSADIPACLGAVSSPARSDEKKAIANNLISYIRGESDNFTSPQKGTGKKNIEEQCRSRKADSEGNIWKLGDIIYSAPRLVDYSLIDINEKFSRLYTGANDGMLHAFKIGELRKGDAAKNQAAVLCDSKDQGPCDHVTLGAEAWTFIPKNALPYLKYLADPNYQHIYTVDLPPYLIQSGGKKILIGGMRFGGSTGCTTTNSKSKNKKFWCGDVNQDGTIDTDIDEDAIQTVPPGAIPDRIANDNLGLSSYFALNITDPDNPEFLWEFTDPAMGFSFSGPAFITRKKANGFADKYVMFLSGPLSNKGGAAPGQDLKIFILKLDPDTFAINKNKIFKLDGRGEDGFTYEPELSGHDQAFGGRLFTNGIDSNEDGSTDVVFFGVNNLVDNNRWQGNVLLVAPTDDDPVSDGTINWEFGKVFGKAFDESETLPPPITNRVGHGVCYDNNYIFFGSGRWFHKFDSRGDEREGERNYLWGIEIDECLEALFDDDDDSECNSTLNTRKHDDIIKTVDCPNRVKSADEISWRETLDGKDDENGFLMERAISDPTFMSNMALFTTTEPSAGGCDYGGRFRTWGFNCRTGHSLFSECITITKPAGTLLLQGSGGNIKSGRIEADTFKEKDLKATEWIPGIADEAGPQFVPEAGKLDGEIILWIER